MELTEITIKNLVENGFLLPGQNLYLKDNNDSDYNCIITDNAKLEVVYKNKTSLWEYPSGAAKSILKISTNGWIKWFLLNNKNEKVFLSDLRIQYFNQSNK